MMTDTESKGLALKIMLAVVTFSLSSCALLPARFQSMPVGDDGRRTELDVQGLVMELADDYIAALGEATYMAAGDARKEPRARTLSQSFLRNGVGAAIDIASGPNPNVALLDILVLASLQAWSYEHHWMKAGIGDGGAASLLRLQTAEAELWAAADKVLSAEQQEAVRGLISAWIEAHPDRMVVSLVRFDEFTDERRMEKEEHRTLAGSLLVDLDTATATVDDARLLGERVLWFSSRYPYVLGEQMELTMYRLADQPEARLAIDALSGVDGVSQQLQEQAAAIVADISAQRSAAFEQLAEERRAAISQAEEALSSLIARTTDETFARLVAEKEALFSEFDEREGKLGDTLDEMDRVIGESIVLAQALQETAGAFDEIVAHFVDDPERGVKDLDVSEIRNLALETGRAAEQLNLLLSNANETLRSEDITGHLASLDALTQKRMDQLFWRGLILVLILLIGLALIRLMPRGRRKS